MRHAFEAWELRGSGRFGRVRMEFRGEGKEWVVFREGRLWLDPGPGYRPLEVRACGICATDLARPRLPFPLPQVVGHEVLAAGDRGERLVVEINASHAARGIETDCPACRAGLGTHCPGRRVLGIQDLPGGFGRWILAPVRAVLEVPDSIGDGVACLIEPFAAALHAVETSPPREGERVAVLGPGRLGLLCLAALEAFRREGDLDFEIQAWGRRESSRELARRFGADRVLHPLEAGAVDLCFDTSGNPDALPLALCLVEREVHLKSTHGRPSAGLSDPTAFVVAEHRILPLEEGERAPDGVPVLGGLGELEERIGSSEDPLPPRTEIRIRGGSGPILSSSRCGDFRKALELLDRDPLARERLASMPVRLLSERDLPEAFQLASSGEAVKVCVLQEGAEL